MSINYVGLAGMAKRKIEAAGRSVTLVKPASSLATSDPLDGTTGAGTTQTVIGVFKDFTDGQIDGDKIRRSDQKLIVAQDSAAGVDLSQYTIVRDGGVQWIVVDVQPKKPGSVALAYVFHLRKG